jgi:RNA polymerase sigma factor (TIGR02999 family)
MDDELDLTELLGRAQAGDTAAAEAVFRATYDELRYIAHVRLGSGRRNTLLDTTALVHEWFVRFARTHRLRIEDRRHFMRYAARAMRTIIVDFARERTAERRGGGQPSLPLLGTEALPVQAPEEILSVHRALEGLASHDARMAEVVELRYFGGLSEPETAEALGVTDRTVRRDWEKARLWLAAALKS